MVDQGTLTDIFGKLLAGERVENWVGARTADLDRVRRAVPETVWERERPGGEWVKILALVAGQAKALPTPTDTN